MKDHYMLDHAAQPVHFVDDYLSEEDRAHVTDGTVDISEALVAALADAARDGGSVAVIGTRCVVRGEVMSTIDVSGLGPQSDDRPIRVLIADNHITYDSGSVLDSLTYETHRISDQ